MVGSEGFGVKVDNIKPVRKYCSSLVSLVQESADSTTLLSKKPECDVQVRKELHAMSRCQVVPPCSQ